MDASVIVVPVEHSHDLQRVYEGYQQQTAVPGSFEVIVVDRGVRSGVADGLAEHRRACPDTPLRLIESHRPGRAAANNAGAAAAGAPLLIFVADDFVPAPTLVRAHVEFHRHLRVAAVGVGPAFFPELLRADPFRRWLEDSGELFGIPFRIAAQAWPEQFFYVGNASIGRALFERAGRFDEAFLVEAFDDFEFGLRLAQCGVRTHFLPKAVAWHDHHLTLAERCEAVRHAGAAARIVELRHPDFRPWGEAGPVPDPLAAARAAKAAARAGLDMAERAQGYKATLDAAFAQGYREAKMVARRRESSRASVRVGNEMH